jgi:nucleoside phosphorylase
MTRLPDDPLDMERDTTGIHVGIVTALPAEYAAARRFLNGLRDRPVKQDPHHYCSAWVPSKDPDRPHRVVAALQTRDGTRDAASLCTDMLRSFPDLRVFVMCGIAGGVPAPRDRRPGVALGDVVVATEGIVDYGHVRRVDGVDAPRRSTSGLSATLLRADRELQASALVGDESWFAPLDATASGTGREIVRREHRPRVVRGAIGSADILLRDADRRDELAERYGIIAFDMETSGVAAAADSHDRHWFVVRGISDYCDNRTKNDVWHGYASLAAAAYVRGLLAECHPFEPFHGAPATVTAASGLQAIVDDLLELAPIRDDYQRRAILAQLPVGIRAAVPDSVTARIHVVGLVRTCENAPGGREALLEALRLTLGATSPEFLRIESVIRRNWFG